MTKVAHVPKFKMRKKYLHQLKKESSIEKLLTVAT